MVVAGLATFVIANPLMASAQTLPQGPKGFYVDTNDVYLENLIGIYADEKACKKACEDQLKRAESLCDTKRAGDGDARHACHEKTEKKEQECKANCEELTDVIINLPFF